MANVRAAAAPKIRLRLRLTLRHGGALGSRAHRDGLYLWELLRALQLAHPQVTVCGSALDIPQGAGVDPLISPTPLDKQVLALGDAALARQRVYLCGSPELVRSLPREVYLAGVPFGRIHSDPFLEPAKP